MRALYYILGVVVGYVGLAALTDSHKLERILFPAILVAAAMIANAFRSRNKIEAVTAAIAVVIAMAYGTGYFRAGAALNWVATWMVLAGLAWVVTGIMAGGRSREFIQAFVVRSKRPSTTDENPFASAKRGTVRDTAVVEPVAPAPPAAPVPGAYSAPPAPATGGV